MLARILMILVAAGTPALAQGQAPEPPSVVKSRCATCHGAKGETTSDEFPRLAGQHEAYLAKEMSDFRAGRRDSIMQRFVKSLSDEEIAAIARYYAAQPAQPPSGTPTELAAVGKFLYQKGNSYSGVPACKGCHGDAAQGTAQLPRLAGQHVAYLEREIKEFTQRSRTNDNAVMHTIAEKLTPLETRALAEYLASLP